MREVELAAEADGAGAGGGGEAWELEAGGNEKGRLLGDSNGYGLDAAAVTHAERRQHHHSQKQGLLQPLGREPAGAGMAEVPVLNEHDHPGPAAAAAAAAAAAQRGVQAGSLNGGAVAPAAGASSSSGAVVAAAAAAVAEGLSAMRQGWEYARARENRDVAALVMMKCCAALVWGAVDILNVRFSDMPAMQTLGDSATTLGLIFASGKAGGRAGRLPGGGLFVLRGGGPGGPPPLLLAPPTALDLT